MTRDETIRVLASLRAAYPHSFKDMGRTDLEAMVELWRSLFADDPYEAVNGAVVALIATRTVGYSPTVGEVKERLQAFRTVDEIGEHEAWALVSKACRNGLYGYREEYAKLPEAVRRAVGAPEQLKAWAAMDSETVESVVASNFMRSYRTHAARKRELDKLPGSVRALIGGLADSMKMLGDGEKPGGQND